MPKRLDNAIQAFTQAIQADPGFALAYADLGIVYGAKYSIQPQDKWADLALEKCNQALALDAAGPAGRICQATLRNAMGEYDRALEDFSAAIGSDSRSANAYRARAYRGRALANQQKNKKTEAEADYSRAIELEPHYWRSYTSLAQLYKIEDRYEDAIKQYELATKETPDNSELLFSLGGVYLDAGYYDKAVAVLEEALKVHPSPEIYENLGTGWLNQGRFEDAIKNFQKAVDLDPDNYLYRGALARAYFWAPGDQRAAAQEQYDKAIALAKQRLKVNLEDSAVNLMLAVYYAMRAQKDDALSHLGHARKLKPDWGELAFWTAIVHLQMDNNRAKALFWLRQARTLGYSAAQINAAPELESLSTDPEFRRLMLTGGKSKSLSSKIEADRRNK
jgi:tetratricopeptide (TPR) repeat protein